MIFNLIFNLIFAICGFCDCNYSSDKQYEMDYADVIIEAKIENGSGFMGYYAYPSKEYKGTQNKRYKIVFTFLDCSFTTFDTLNPYLIYANFNEDSTLYVSRCSRTIIADKSYDSDFLVPNFSDSYFGPKALKLIASKLEVPADQIEKINTAIGFDWLHAELDEDYDTEDPKRIKYQFLSESSFYDLHPRIVYTHIIHFTSDEQMEFIKRTKEPYSNGIILFTIYDQEYDRNEFVAFLMEN